MKILWNMILQRVNAVSKQVQRPDIELGLAVKQLESLCAFVADLRENFHQSEALATDTSHEKPYRLEIRRKTKRKTFPEENPSEDVEYSAGDKYRIETFNVILEH
jgi:hypothetical protein